MLTERELARRAGVSPERVRRMAGAGLLAGRAAAEPYQEADVRRVRLAAACEEAGLDLGAIGGAIAAGQL